MANNTVAITLTIDEANALKAWTNQQAAVEKLKQKLAALKAPENPLGPVQAGALKAMSTLGQVVVSITGIGSAIAGVMALANQLKAEYQMLKSRQQEAAGSNVDYAKELASAVRSTGGQIGGPEMDRLIMQGSKKVGQTPATVAAAFNAVFTAIGPRNKEEALGAMGTAENVLQQYPEQDPMTIKQLSAVTAQNKRVFGLTDQEALGYQQQAQNQSFVKDVASFATNVAGKLSAVAKSGDFTAAEAGALTGTLSQMGGDLEGATSTMAALTMGAELKERLPNIKSGAERIRFMQQNPELQKAYLEGGKFPGTDKTFPAAETGRSIYKPHVLDLFDKNSQVAREFEKNIASFGGAPDWMRQAAAVRKEVSSAPSIQIAAAQRQGEASSKQLQVLDTQGAIAGVSRKISEDMLKSVGESDIAQKLAKISFEVGSSFGTDGPLAVVIEQIDTKAKDLRRVGEMTDDGFGNEYYKSFKTQEQADKDSEKAGVLEDAKQKLLSIQEDYQRSLYLKKAEPIFGQVRGLREQIEAGKTPANTDAVLQEADRKIRRIASESSATSTTAGNDLMKTMIELTQSIKELRDAVKTDAKAVDENTKTLPKPGTQPTPRPPNVASLQDRRK